MKKTHPKVLYKYRSLNQLSLELLLTNSIYCANPLTFNDPLDCSPRIDIDMDLDEANYSSYTFHVDLHLKKIKDLISGYGTSSRTQQILESIAVARAEDMASLDATSALIDGYEQILSDALISYFDPGVFAMSEDQKSQLMWSHYGDQHKGLCIGYSTFNIDKSKLHKVKYVRNNLGVKLSHLQQMQELGKDSKYYKDLWEISLLRKTNHWKYEKEWRYIEEGTGLKKGFRVTEVIFGLKFSEAIKSMLMTYLKDRDIDFYQVYRKDDSYDFDIVKINYD